MPTVGTPPPTVTTSALPTTPNFGLPFVPDIDFAVKDPAIISSEVIADYQAAFLELTGIAKALAPGDPVRLFLLVVCDWLSQQRTIIDFTGKQNLLKYSAGSFLDNLAALYGERALRLPATFATTTLRFTVATTLAASVTVPKGTLCQAPNAIVFQTLADAVIPAGATTVDTAGQATSAGAIGNGFLAGQINGVINWNQNFAVTVTNTTPTAGGSDAETDDSYRYRIWLAIESFSTCGPEKAYEFWGLSADPSIIQIAVHSAPEIAGEVWLYPLCKDASGNPILPSSDILAKVQAACSPATRRPLTDFVTAKVPTPFLYTLSMDYYILASNAVLQDSIQTAVEQAANDWIIWERSQISRDIIGDELSKRCLEAGAKRIVIHSPTPSFQVLNFDQIAFHNTTAPIINFAGLEDP